MKKSVIPLLLLLLCFCSHTKAQSSYRLKSWVKTKPSELIAYNKPMPEAWELVFEDNFDGSRIDTGKWHTSTNGWKRNHANNLHYYMDENIVVKEGVAMLVAKREPNVRKGWFADVDNGNGGWREQLFEYTSAIIETKEKYDHGFFEARCRIPDGRGFWPAFWLFGEGGEIDIFEFNTAKPKKHYITVHSWPENGQHQQIATVWRSPVSFSEEFHTFSLEWDKWKMVFRVDGIVRRVDFRYITLDGKAVEDASQFDPDNILENPVFPTGKQCVKLNLAIPDENSSFQPMPNARTPFPSSLDIDYIRIYN